MNKFGRRDSWWCSSPRLIGKISEVIGIRPTAISWIMAKKKLKRRWIIRTRSLRQNLRRWRWATAMMMMNFSNSHISFAVLVGARHMEHKITDVEKKWPTQSSRHVVFPYRKLNLSLKFYAICDIVPSRRSNIMKLLAITSSCRRLQVQWLPTKNNAMCTWNSRNNSTYAALSSQSTHTRYGHRTIYIHIFHTRYVHSHTIFQFSYFPLLAIISKFERNSIFHRIKESL